jgi:8-oxo-dGTP pyrophosphatase MutT (NUDIX family)
MNDPTLKSPPLRHASTAIVLREHQGEVQVLMTRRHAALAFMGGMWVFPGGTLAEADQGDSARKLVIDAQSCSHKLLDLTGSALPQRICVALAIAACRETFEETGVLLARRADGSSCDPGQLARLQAQRKAIAADPGLFVATLLQEELRLDIAQFIYWAHWITPSNGPPRRFDTRFFVAAAPESHDFVADTYETTECVWMSPENLLAAAARHQMPIAQPTRYNLEDLRMSVVKHGSLAALLRNEANRHVGAIMPKLVKDNDRTVIVMPWDERYRDIPGESVDAGQYYEPALTALPSRVERDH